jgi:Kef-type K+ transport system membrane component KefB
MKKLKTVLKIAIVAEILSIPVLAVLISNSSCKNNGTDCGLAGFGALYMVFPLGLTILLYILVKLFEIFSAKSAKPNQKPNLFWILMSTVFILAVGFLLYFQSIS